MHERSLADDPPRRPRAAVLVAHSSPVVSLGLIHFLHDRRADVIQVFESEAVMQTAGFDAQLDLLIGDDAGVETHLRASPQPSASRSTRLMIAPGHHEPSDRSGIERWVSIECSEEELLEAVDQLLDGQRGRWSAASAPARDFSSGLTPGVRRRLLAYIDDNLAEPIETRVLARMAGLSDCHFARAFKQSFGAPPHRFLMLRRIERAAQRVRQTDRSLIDIALDFGFSDQSHFTRLFGRLVGETPSVYRSRHRRVSAPECSTVLHGS